MSAEQVAADAQLHKIVGELFVPAVKAINDAMDELELTYTAHKPIQGEAAHKVLAYRVVVAAVAGLRDAGLLLGPGEVAVPREALRELVRHVRHDVLCTPQGPEAYEGPECCRHGACEAAERDDEIHGAWVGSLGRHPALTDDLLARLDAES